MTVIEACEGDPRLDAVRRRAKEADGLFVFAVLTTGIYCRPSCAAKPAKVENIRFFSDGAAARAAGYRACKRCAPDDARTPHAAVLAEACAMIDAAEETPGVAAIAARCGVGARHLQRLFKESLGVSPSAYARAVRAEKLRGALEEGENVTAAAYGAGYGSLGRANAEARAVLGMAPSAYRAKGRGERVRYAHARSDLGVVLVAATEKGVCAIDVGEDADALVAALERRFEAARALEGDPRLEGYLRAVLAYLDDPGRGLDLPLDARGTAFQEKVWRALSAIPLGETRTYGEIAAMIGAPKAARAVGAALGANPAPLARPCHRVTPQKGVGGYRLGGERKAALLARERAAAAERRGER